MSTGSESYAWKGKKLVIKKHVKFAREGDFQGTDKGDQRPIRPRNSRRVQALSPRQGANEAEGEGIILQNDVASSQGSGSHQTKLHPRGMAGVISSSKGVPEAPP